MAKTGESKIIAIQKESNKSIYVFSKGKDFLTKIIEFLTELGLSQAELALSEYINDKPFIPEINKLIDERKQVFNEIYDFHLIFGHKKVFMLVFYKEDKQKEISDKLTKHFPIEKIKGKKL